MMIASYLFMFLPQAFSKKYLLATKILGVQQHGSNHPQPSERIVGGMTMNLPNSRPTCWLDGKFRDIFGEYDEVNNRFVRLWKECDGFCIEATEKCHGKCDSVWQCESENGSCQDSTPHISMLQNCEGRCIPVEDLCSGNCTENQRCELEGKCLKMYDSNEEYVLKDCEGSCIDPKKKCNGECDEYGQCETDDGICVSTSKSRKSCNGKCIPFDEPCEGECVHLDQCLLNGKCKEKMLPEGEMDLKEVWKDCDGACINMTSKCQGKCGFNQCDRKGKCLKINDFKNGKQLWKNCKGKCLKFTKRCNGECGYNQCQKGRECRDIGKQYKECNKKCIKMSDKCNGVCRDDQCVSKSGKCKELVGENFALRHGRCKGKCIDVQPNNSTKTCDGTCTKLPGFKHMLDGDRCFYVEGLPTGPTIFDQVMAMQMMDTLGSSITVPIP